MVKTIIIFNLSRKTGGTDNLMANLAIMLANNTNYCVHYIDYADSPIKHTINSQTSKVGFIDYYKKIKLDNGLLICTLLSVKILQEHFDLTENVRLLFWSTHPDDGLKILPSFNLWLRLPLKVSKVMALLIHPFYKTRIKNFLSIGMQRSGIVWMDDINITSNKIFYNLKHNPIYWPIYTGKPRTESRLTQKFFESNINIVILGRLCDFKIFSLHGLFDQINEYKALTGKDISLDFIGDGPFKSQVENWLIQKQINKYRFLGNINIADLDKLLVNYHLLIGMGTSALEGAKLKIPTLLSDATYELLPSNKVKLRWLCDVNAYHVGRLVSNNENEIEGKTFIEIMKDIHLFEDWKKIGINCQKHWFQYHSQESLLEITKSTIDKNAFYYSKEVQKLLCRDLTGYLLDRLKKLIK